MALVYYYKVWCDTDCQYEYVWKTEPPTVCPVNNPHTIDTSSISIEDQTGNQIIEIREENIPTGGNFKAELHAIDYAAGPNVTTEKDFTWPFPINVLQLEYTSTVSNLGDEIQLCVAPDTIIGNILQNISIGATQSIVSDTVIDNIYVGYNLSLTDGTNVDDCGRVISIDKVNKIITWETATINAYSASTPTFVRMTVYVVDNYSIGPPQKYTIGSSKIGGSYVPANQIVRIRITNNDILSKKLYAEIEYLY